MYIGSAFHWWQRVRVVNSYSLPAGFRVCSGNEDGVEGDGGGEERRGGGNNKGDGRVVVMSMGL